MPTHANALAIIVKAPRAGLVKTRLAPPLTHEQAAEFYRALLLDQLTHLESFSDAERYVAYAPDDAEAMLRELAGADYGYLPQRGDDLGMRMKLLFEDLWQRGHSKIVLIGSDLPPLPLAILHDAFTRLNSTKRQVVLGPSRDGGYYLVGMNRPTPQLFENMTWSHDRVLAQTIKKLTSLGIGYDLLARWFDIDSLDDVRRLRGLTEPAIRQAMPRTQEYLDKLNQLGCLDERA